MYFPRSFLVALLSAPFLAFAQSSNENPFNTPASGMYSVTAGQTLKLSWKPTTDGTVSLVLRYGASNDLTTISTIATDIDNSGSYTWNVPSDLPRGDLYTVEISSSEGDNYTNRINVDSTNTADPTGAASSSGMSMTSAASTSMPSSSSASSSGSMTMSTDSSASMTMTGSSTMMTSSTTGSSSSASESSPSASNGDLVATGSSSTSSGTGAKATAMVGMLGAVALGALAL